MYSSPPTLKNSLLGVGKNPKLCLKALWVTLTTSAKQSTFHYSESFKILGVGWGTVTEHNLKSYVTILDRC